MPSVGVLSGRNILITRPIHQAVNLERQLLSLEAKALSFPCIEIVPNSNAAILDQLSSELAQIDLCIFISPNAANLAIELLPELAQLKCVFAAVGSSSAKILNNSGILTVITPKEDRSDSEGLLALQQLKDVSDKRVLILKGQGGRELLTNELKRRGARVTELEVYRRTIPTKPDLSILNHRIDVILFTSSESVENFIQLTPQDRLNTLLNCPTIVGHHKISRKVSSLGFKKLPIIATSPSDRDMLTALKQWSLC